MLGGEVKSGRLGVAEDSRPADDNFEVGSLRWGVRNDRRGPKGTEKRVPASGVSRLQRALATPKQWPYNGCWYARLRTG